MTRDAFEYAKSLLVPGDIIKVTNKTCIGGFSPNARFTPRIGVFVNSDRLYLRYSEKALEEGANLDEITPDCQDHYKKIISIEKL